MTPLDFLRGAAIGCFFVGGILTIVRNNGLYFLGFLIAAWIFGYGLPWWLKLK
ncbi:MAG TPA: hypothetical protein VFL30_00120 [Rhodanobacteraceae bacterium]|nr:hypothetical protein [Rhodanobacteraceae bacterium]